MSSASQACVDLMRKLHTGTPKPRGKCESFQGCSSVRLFYIECIREGEGEGELRVISRRCSCRLNPFIPSISSISSDRTAVTMDRPVSAASSNTTPSVSSHPNGTGSALANGHRRTKSTARVPTWASLITLYITNLRLLNLDLLPDWPDITATTFSNADARARIRASEWSLYQLFRLYDPALTADRLQPFFPPLEPLQSINLRAALYRCLDGLKKNGVLGRETVLRKTMLDECSGDKFWEVCMVLSALVLRKVILEKRSRNGARPVAQRLGTAQGLGKKEREMLVPMALAHKAALAKVLQEKQAVRERLAKLDAILEDKESDLAKRRAELQERARGGRSQKQMETLDAVSQHIKKGWTGDDTLRDAIVSGENGSSQDRALLGSTESFIGQDDSNNAAAEAGVLEDIEQKARTQNLRLRRWQAMYDKLQASKPQNANINGHSSTTGSSEMRFDKHSDLTLDTVRAQRPAQAAPASAASSYASRYDTILTTLREDLRQAQGHRRTATMPVQFGRKPSITLDAVAGAQNSTLHQRQHSRSPSSAQRSPGPFRPGIGRRVSSRSKSYQQPKVISQREPIPLKSEIFSPLKTTRRGSGSSTSTSRPTSLLPSPREEEAPVSASIDDALSAQRSKQGSVSSAVDSAAKIDSAVGFGLGIESDSPQDMGTPPAQPDALEFKKPSLPPPSQAGQAPRPSLAERTRMSMAFTSSEDTRQVTQPASPVSAPPVSNANLIGEEVTPSLADRTRQSISHFSQLPSTTSALERKPSSKPSHARTRSSIVTSSYPVNQFDTPPRKMRRSSFGAGNQSLMVEEEGPASSAGRNITPRDKLFEADAEYDSVFKARPRIAVSPVLSPSVLEDEEMEMARLGDSSPLGGR